MVNLNDSNRNKRTEKVSLYIVLLFVQNLLLLAFLLLLLNCCAVDLAFEQTARRGAGVPAGVFIRELVILLTRRINLRRKGKFFSLIFYPTSFSSNHCPSSLVGYVNGGQL